MIKNNTPIFFALWTAEGSWEIRDDKAHQPGGRRHVHIRRRRGRKGEFSWNDDGTRHDKNKFPVSEGMINSAKEIVSEKLGIPVGSLQLVTSLTNKSCIYIDNDNGIVHNSIYANSEVVILVSEEWLVMVSILNKENLA